MIIPLRPDRQLHHNISKLRLEDLLLTQAFFKQEMMSLPSASFHPWNESKQLSFRPSKIWTFIARVEKDGRFIF